MAKGRPAPRGRKVRKGPKVRRAFPGYRDLPGQQGRKVRPVQRLMDRFLLIGIDACTDPNLAPTLEGCQDRLPLESTLVQKFLYPEGCVGRLPDLSTITSSSKIREGCPPQQNVSASTDVADDTADVFIIQGGEVRFSGFGLTVGFKITF